MAARKKEVLQMARQFAALRVVGTILKVLGWLSLIVGVLVAIGVLIFGFALTDQLGLPGIDLGGPLAGIAGFVAALVVGILYFLLLYAAGEAIYLFLCIEENTRRTAYYMEQQYVHPEPSYPESAYAPPATQGFEQ
jgi:hypothetical protein